MQASGEVPGARGGVSRPRHVTVYGVDHSPWVQAVLLGLREAGIDHTLVTAPAPSVFLRSGVYMPAARFDDGPWMIDSARILSELGYGPVEEEDRKALLKIFLAGARDRVDHPWTFFHRFSLVRDGHPSPVRRLLNQPIRAFVAFYFFTLLSGVRLFTRRRTDDQIVASLAHCSGRLESHEDFLGGDRPDTVDFQLFGMLQMFASIPRRALDLFLEEPKLHALRRWAERMQARVSTSDRLYTGPYLEPRCAGSRPGTASDRALYWMGCALVVAALPISFVLAFWLAFQVGRKGLR